MAAVRTTGLLPASVLDTASIITTLLLAGGMLGLGLGVHFRAVLKTGGRPLLLGGVATATAAVVALLGVILSGYVAA
jgi:uncharacterized membrane protein YadS